MGQIYRSPTEIVGPAFINAYKIENEISKSARIVIGPVLLDQIILLSWENHESMMVSDDKLISLSPKIFFKDKDHKNIDYLKELEIIRDNCSSDYNKEKYTTIQTIEPNRLLAKAQKTIFVNGIPSR